MIGVLGGVLWRLAFDFTDFDLVLRISRKRIGSSTDAVDPDAAGFMYLAWLQSGNAEPEQCFVGAGAGEVDRDTSCVADDNGADLEQFQPDGAALCARHLGAFQRQPPDRFD